MISNKANKAVIHEILEEFSKNGIEELKNSIEKLLNQLMVAEREDFIGAAPYERTPERKTYANEFKNKKLLTRTDELDLKVPQVRDGDFYPSCLEKGEKVEQSLKVALAEAYVQGVFTRRMKDLTEELCGKENPLLKYPGLLLCWMKRSLNSQIDRLVIINICTWMHSMKRCAMKEVYVLLQY